ncbi:hypothetical protein CERSUDRAFT_99513 [Gelatoporia subvermispora B]|uniref:Uncharacterized protein n=1 Tax=Ceriporiopsis subvermispora (strain B) TaxID=914234 RepID=M2QK10_CERS8|nr:hypothetical protein CERSUDRAFT_99513 [Gelatoporia subvermispora B]
MASEMLMSQNRQERAMRGASGASISLDHVGPEASHGDRRRQDRLPTRPVRLAPPLDKFGASAYGSPTASSSICTTPVPDSRGQRAPTGHRLEMCALGASDVVSSLAYPAQLTAGMEGTRCSSLLELDCVYTMFLTGARARDRAQRRIDRPQ